MKKIITAFALLLAIVILTLSVYASCPLHGSTYLYQYCSDVVASYYTVGGTCSQHGSNCFRMLYRSYTWEYCAEPTCGHYLDDRPGHEATASHRCVITHTEGSNEDVCNY